MAVHALDHVARTPNAMTPDGKMTHDKKLAFVQAMTKHGLQHFDAGGPVKPGGSPLVARPMQPQASAAAAPANAQPIAATYNPPAQAGGVAESAPATNTAPQTTTTGNFPTAGQTWTTFGDAYHDPQGAAQGLTDITGNGLKDISASLTAQNEFQAQNANIQNGTSTNQLNNAYMGVQGGLNQQQYLADNLTPGINQAANAQANLSNQLTAQSNGQGPNPAQALYRNNVQNIAKQQAGAIASTKGISPALQAELAAQQGSAAMQNAAGQGAALAAQQQIAAQNNLQNLSATQVAEGQGAIQGVNNAQQNEQNILQGANTAANNANVSMTSNTNNVNSTVAGQNANAINGTSGGILGGIGSVAAAFFADGGKVGHYADGGIAAPQTSAPTSFVGQWLNSSPAPSSISSSGPPPLGGTAAFSGLSMPGGGGKGGGGGAAAEASGGRIKAAPGQKAVASGDNYSNDKIPALLSEGEVVIDRETLADKGPVGKAARMIAAHIAQRNKARGVK